MRLLLLLCAGLILSCGCGRPLGLDRLQPNAGRVEGLEYRLLYFHPAMDTTGHVWFRLRVRNKNAYPVDVYLLEGVQAGDTLSVVQTTYATQLLPHFMRIAPGKSRTQEFRVSTKSPQPIELTGWFVFPLDSLDAPSTHEQMLGHPRARG